MSFMLTNPGAESLDLTFSTEERDKSGHVSVVDLTPDGKRCDQTCRHNPTQFNLVAAATRVCELTLRSNLLCTLSLPARKRPPRD